MFGRDMSKTGAEEVRSKMSSPLPIHHAYMCPWTYAHHCVINQDERRIARRVSHAKMTCLSYLGKDEACVSEEGGKGRRRKQNEKTKRERISTSSPLSPPAMPVIGMGRRGGRDG